MFRNRTLTVLLGLSAGLAACEDPSTENPTEPALAPAANGAAPAAAVRYVLTRLAEGNGSATAINSKGQIVGYVFNSGTLRAFLWSNGTMRFLGSLGGGTSFAHAINEAGQVAGMSLTANNQRHAFLWANGTMRDLGTLGADASVALGIDGNGRVVGYTEKVGGPTRAFLWENGMMQRLAGLGTGFSIAHDIDNMGRVVGEYGSQSAPRAFRWVAGRVRDLGTLGGTTATANAIGADGKIVGYATTAAGVRRAFLWQSGVMTDLGTLAGDSSIAYAISGVGHVAGFTRLSPSRLSAFVLSNGVKYTLGEGDAYGVNREGWVVGRSLLLGSYVALWRPTTEPPPPPGAITVGTSYFLSDRNQSINPAVDTVPVGRKVTWTWVSGRAVLHSVQSTGTPSFPSSALMGGVGTTYSFTFTKTGIYRYNCVAHPGKMTGRVVVR
jgi:probable HAF family extracellular repeat protein